MNATQPCTNAAPGSITDQNEGFPRLRARYARMSDEALTKEYLDGMKHCFGRMFGQNAQREQDVIAETLISRGITQIPNIFGPIEVNTSWHKLGIAPTSNTK